MRQTGRIMKAISDLLFVQTQTGLLACKARGIFRRQSVAPHVGDFVEIEQAADGTGTVEKVLPRRNFLTRPPVANIDTLFIISSVCDPAPNLLIMDKMIATAEVSGIEPVVVLTKNDLADGEAVASIYRAAGISVICTDLDGGKELARLRAMLAGKTSVFTGNSGVGKSTLVNLLEPQLMLATGEISRKLGRGKHTTRQVSLYPVAGDGYLADTPGFSTMDIERYGFVKKEELVYGFREFAPYLGQCQFVSCSHTCEKGCAVLQAVREGKIQPSRHESYVTMYNEVKDIKEWNLQKNV